MDVQQLKELVAAKLDVLELLDILDYTIYELVEALEDEITEHSVELERACE